MQKPLSALLTVLLLILASTSIYADTDSELAYKEPELGDIEIGDYYQGGVVFWLDPNYSKPEQHGLIAALADSSGGFGYKWDSSNILFLIGADGNGFYAGKNLPGGNTYYIINAISTGQAASACVSVGTGGYDNWYLPSLTELALMYDLRLVINDTALKYNGQEFSASRYWSSTEYNIYRAYYYNWGGYSDNFLKQGTLAVRCVRYF